MLYEVITCLPRTDHERADGRVTIEVLPKPLGNPPSHFDLAMNGIADVV